MKTLSTDVAEYLENKINCLEQLYQWQFDAAIPEARFGSKIPNKSWAKKTRSLRWQLRKFLKDNQDQNSALKVARYLIHDWGRIPQFKRCKQVVVEFANVSKPDDISNCCFGFDGISSWSKWASFVRPAWACTYDARVAYSINAINFLKGGFHKIFPSPPGRNPRLLALDVATLVRAKKLSRADRPWDLSLDPAFEDKTVSKGEVYRTYLELVRAVSERLWGNAKHIQTVEMLLFGMADGALYRDVISDLRTNYRKSAAIAV